MKRNSINRLKTTLEYFSAQLSLIRKSTAFFLRFRASPSRPSDNNNVKISVRRWWNDPEVEKPRTCSGKEACPFFVSYVKVRFTHDGEH